MGGSYDQMIRTRRLENESAFVKTYLLEYTWPNSTDNVDEVSLLQETLAWRRGANRPAVKPLVRETLEQGFYQVDWHGRNGGIVRVYLDTSSDPSRRFWIGYSLTNATDLDEAVHRVASHQPVVDRVWLWPKLLTQVLDRGDFRGIGLDYDFRRFDPSSSPGESTDYLKMQVWGGSRIKEILHLLAERGFGHQLAIAKVRLKYRSHDDVGFAIEDVKYNGKFTTRGTSFDAHQEIVAYVRREYANTITGIEKRFTIRDIIDGGLGGIDGEPILFDLSKRTIDDLDAFCDVVFAGSLPFRLWGRPRPTDFGDEGRLVSAVDLHTGSKLFFEIYADRIAMYLHAGACGNTVARFFTNLQHTLGSLIEAEADNGDAVF